MLAASARPAVALRSSYSSSQSSAAFHAWPSANSAAAVAVASSSSSSSSSNTATSARPSITTSNARPRSAASRATAGHNTQQRRSAQIYASSPKDVASSSHAVQQTKKSLNLAPNTIIHSASSPNRAAPGSGSASPTLLHVTAPLTSHAAATNSAAGATSARSPLSSPLHMAQQNRWLRASPATRSSPNSPDSPSDASPSNHSNMSSIPSQFNAITGEFQEEEDGDHAWAFGGGSSSRGGPINEHDEQPSSSDRQTQPRRSSAEPVIVGSAGKGAVSGYGRRRRSDGLASQSKGGRGDYQSAQSIWQINFGVGAGSPPSDQNKATTERAEEDEKIASHYVHKYSPSTRSSKALAQHTYFSTPSANSITAPSLAFPPDKEGILRPPQQKSDSGSDQKAAQIAPPVTSQPSPSDGAHRGIVGEGAPLSSSRHPLLLPKPTALVLPGQGSQYVGMSKDLYRSFRAARTIWCEAEEALMVSADSYLREFDSKRDVGVDFGWVNGIGGEARGGSRRDFEEALEVSRKWDPRLGFGATGTAIARRRRGYLRDLVFSGDQLELTKAENASVSIFTCSMAFLATLKRDFDIDLIKAHVAFASGHGTSGTYSALCASGVLQLTDAVRFLRHRGLICGKVLNEDPRLFPEGCDRPASVFQTWAFANASTAPPEMRSADDEFTQQSAFRPHWKRTIMCGVVVRPGQLQRMTREIKNIKEAIQQGQVAGIERDEFVDVANFNGERQIVLGGTKVAVDYTCERLRSKGLGARAVNLPTSGPYHTSMMKGAQELLLPAINALPLRPPALVQLPQPGEPQPQWSPRLAKTPDPGTPALRVISSMDPQGPPLADASVIRAELRRTMATPVQWAGSVRRLIEEEGVRRFVCIGPGRACAHLLSRELAEYERANPIPPPPPSSLSSGSDVSLTAPAAPGTGWGFEVWSIATVEDVELLGELLANLSPEETRGLSRLSVQRPAHGSDLYTHEEMMAL
ncbi:hypothetical protein CF327_g3265 [Tilletia walkeri]|nr:hypothetical protein CF327_g3265 [Tilletia walkeri]